MLLLDRSAVASRLDRNALIDALDAAFREFYTVPARQHYSMDPIVDGESGATLLVMPAWQAGVSLGVKIVTVFPDNVRRGLAAVCASYLLLDAATGQPLALLDGGELTLRRTAAASALASRYLSAPHSSRLLMVGTGNLVTHLIHNHALVRPIREVRIWGRRADQARRLAVELSTRELSVECAEDLEASTRWADIVSCATLSRQPLVAGAWLRPGQHLDLVGAFTPQMMEVDDAALKRSEVFVDTRLGALRESGEIVGAIARGVIDETSIRAELSELATHSFKRSRPQAITLFKSVGTALEDLAAARLALSNGNESWHGSLG